MFKKLFTSMIAASLALSAATPAIAGILDGRSAEEFRTTLSAECYATKNTGGINKTELTCYDKAWIDYWRADDNSGRLGNIVWLRVGDDIVTITTKEIREGGREAIETVVVNHIVATEVAELEEVIEQLTEMQERLETLEAALVAAGLNQKQVKAAMKAAHAKEIENLTNEHAKAIAEQAAASEEEISKITSELALVKANLESVQTQLTNAEAEVASLTAQLEEANADVEAIQAKLDTANAKVESLESQLSVVQMEVVAKTAELAAATSNNAELAAEIADLKAQVETIAGLNDEIADLESQIATLKADATTNAETITDLEEQVATLKAQKTTGLASINDSLNVYGIANLTVDSTTKEIYDAGFTVGTAASLKAISAHLGTDTTFDSMADALAAVEEAAAGNVLDDAIAEAEAIVVALNAGSYDNLHQLMAALAANGVNPAKVNVHVNDNMDGSVAITSNSEGEVTKIMGGTRLKFEVKKSDTVNHYTGTFNLSNTAISALTSLDLSYLANAIEGAYDKGYQDGYSDGYNDGYVDGYKDGFADGVNSVGA